MIKIVISFFLFLALTSCRLELHTGNDYYAPRADLLRDEKPHFKNSLEWWYFTGHLKDRDSGRDYGIEYVFFHFNPRNKKDYLMVHSALTDEEGGAFFYDYRIQPLRRPLDSTRFIDFRVKRREGYFHLEGDRGRYRLDSRMSREKVGMVLETRPVKAPFFQGLEGFFFMEGYAKAGYYSYPRLATQGQLFLKGDTLNVEGELWYDRQWNCAGMVQDEVAWDWMAIQMEGQKEELMLYAIHQFEEGKVTFSGTYCDENEKVTYIGRNDLHFKEKEYWVSPETNVAYPTVWEVEIPRLGYSLEVRAVFPGQELDMRFGPVRLSYWEGKCRVRGQRNGKPVRGKAYVEMNNRKKMGRSAHYPKK